MGLSKTDKAVTAGALACLALAIVGGADILLGKPLLGRLFFESQQSVLTFVLIGFASGVKLFRHRDPRISLLIACAGLWMATSHLGTHLLGMASDTLNGGIAAVCLSVFFSISAATRLLPGQRARFGFPIVLSLLLVQATSAVALLLWMLAPGSTPALSPLGDFSPYEAALIYVLSAIYFEELNLDQWRLDQDKSGRHFILRFVFFFPLICLALAALPHSKAIAQSFLFELSVAVSALIFIANAFMVVLGLGFLRKDMESKEEIRRTNQTLRDYVFELEAANQEILELSERQTELAQKQTQFATILAHEIRTPLNTITGLTNELKANAKQKVEGSLVFTLAASVDNLLALVNSVLDYTKVKEGKLQPLQESFRLKSAFESVSTLYRNRAWAQGLDFSMTVSSSLPRWIVGDEVRIRQILGNLIDNAFKFTQEGVVHVHASARTHGQTEMLHISVRDTGTGIPEDSQQQIFEPFKQASSHTQRTHGGTGVGLALCRELAGALGGTLEIESSSTAGSTFVLSLPLVAGSAVAQADAMNEEDLELTGLKGLMVEDHELNAKINSRLLERMGMSIELAADGPAALELAKSNQYDVILMDINLNSDMDGLQTTAEIQKFLGNNAPPVVALTAGVIGLNSAHLAESGMAGYLEKPFSKSQALKVLRPFLHQISGAGSLRHALLGAQS